MYQNGVEFLESTGYHRYEISNFSKEHFESRHNLSYWQHKEYITMEKIDTILKDIFKEKPKATLYHYTSIEVLALILKSKRIRLNRVDKVNDLEKQLSETKTDR